jgi:hypothetical protein
MGCRTILYGSAVELMDRSGEIHWAFDRDANAPKATDKEYRHHYRVC